MYKKLSSFRANVKEVYFNVWYYKSLQYIYLYNVLYMFKEFIKSSLTQRLLRYIRRIGMSSSLSDTQKTGSGEESDPWPTEGDDTVVNMSFYSTPLATFY